jgi:SAM-dependent methyltransferase
MAPAISRIMRPLRRVPWIRSSVYLAIVIRHELYHPWTGLRRFEQQYARGPDSWGYDKPSGAIRLARAADLLDTVTKGRRFQSALEVGCAEGAFTELLAARCDRVIAADFSPTALKRARTRRDWSGCVEFRCFDLLREPMDGKFDLITVMDVLDCFPTRLIRAACDKIVAALPPGGYLLMTGCRQSDVFDTAWWSRWIIRGGVRIQRHISEIPVLELVDKIELDTHVMAIFTKVRPSEAPQRP